MTMSATLSNTEAVAETIDQRDQREQERRKELGEIGSLQDRLERQLAEESIDVPVGDETVPFRPFDREASQFAAVLQERIETLGEHEDVEAAFDEAVDRMYAVAAEFSKPNFADMDWWEDQFSIPRMIAVLKYVNQEGQSLDESETKK